MAQFLFKRSGTADKRPDPAQMALGEVDLNYNAVSGGLFYKDSGGGVIKVGPAQVSVDPPNATPAGSAGNSPGEFWYSTSDGFLYVWDGSNWNTTAPGVGLASPTIPGVVYGLTADTELNVALGKGAGSNITTGTCNVALGPNVAVASATGNCQLALGYSATANWLTGDSTKAIKPGAGIIDCAGSCGTAGQVLSSDGANAIEWITGAGINPSAFTQCGDILVGTGAGTYSALAVPRTVFPTVGIIDGYALVSCGACAEGVAWGNPFLSSAALVASTTGSIPVNGCDYGNSVCVASVLPGPGSPGQILTNAYDSGNPGYLAGQGYLNWCTPDFISQSSFGPGALVVGCTPGSTGGICTVGSIVNANNPGVAVGYYQGVTVTTCSGSGSGALATVNVINGGYFPIFDGVEITQPGTGYALGNAVGFVICGTTVTTQAQVCSLNQSTICKAGYLPVGTNGQVLTADSTCALGVKWAASGGVPSATPTVAGVVFGCTASSTIALGCNSQAGSTTGDNNVSVGFNSLCTNSTGSRNTAVGSNTLCSQTGNNGTAVGFSALLANTGDNNTAVGLCAAICNSSGSSITAVGANTLLNNTTGFANSAFGSGALNLNNIGQRNVSVGYNSLVKNTSGSFNVGLGDTALGCNTTGGCNVGVGFYTLALGTTGCFNVALGHLAGCGSTGGNCNVVIGPCAQVANLTGSCQLAVGFACDALWLTGDSTKAIKPGAGIIDCAGSCGTAGQVLMSNGSNAICWGTAGGGSAATPTVAGIVLGTTTASNTGIGCNALNTTLTGTDNVAAGLCALFAVTGGLGNAAVGNFAAAGTTTGCYNVAMGLSALRTNSTGTRNVALGENAGRGNTTGCFNVAIGSGALRTSSTATDNTAVGFCALFSNDTSSGNTALGSLSLLASTGTLNTGLGLNALRGLTTGACNLAIGANAACTSTSGNLNVAIGTAVQLPVITGSCQLAIGFGANYWLTGDSTKAIKPGAGILDCNNSTGTVGQALLSDGANAVVWGSAGISPDLFCCQDAAGCGSYGGNLIVGGFDGSSILPVALYPGEPGQILTVDPVNIVNPLKWCSANYLCGACFAKGSIPVGCAQVGGGIQTVSFLNQNNPGKPPGYYTDVPVSGGSGTGATVNVTIINAGYFPAVDGVEVANPGSGYLVGNSGLQMTIDGTTLTTTLTVNSLNTNTVFNYSYLPVGTNGQVLTADSACTNGVKWAAAAAGIPCATVTGKGAIVTGTAASTPTALSVGANGQILIADSACTTGLKWGPNTAGTVSAATPTVQGIVFGSYDCGTIYPDTAWDYVSLGYCALACGGQFNNFQGVTALGNCAVQTGGSCYLTAVGWCAGAGANGSFSTWMGSRAGAAEAPTSSGNVGIGFCTGVNMCGINNVALGTTAAAFLCGCDNVFLGNSSGPYFGTQCATTVVNANVGIGFGAATSLGLVATTTSTANTLVGSSAGYLLRCGSYNVALGDSANVGSCASNNVSIGRAAGLDLTTGLNNIIIGCCAATATGGVSGSLTTQSNRIVMGNSAHTCAQIQIAWTTTSDVRDKALDPAGVPYGLLFVENLEPIAYRWCDRNTDAITDEKLRYGFSAQNIRELEGEDAVIVSDDNPDKLMITDQHLLPVLVNAIKELSERNRVLEARITALESGN